MLVFKRIGSDKYLHEFVEFCKDRYKDNLVAITIYGSYAWGYFDKKKSDYDIFVIFNNTTPKDRKEINKMFPKVTLQYFCTTNDLLRKVEEGHWSVYITLLKSARLLYYTKEYKHFIKRLAKIDFIEKLMDIAAMEYKADFEINVLKKDKGYKAAKWALPSIRKRLQLLTYIKTRKVIWDLKRVVKLNKNLLTKTERDYILELNKRVMNRGNIFTSGDKETAISILKKLNHQILYKELISLERKI